MLETVNTYSTTLVELETRGQPNMVGYFDQTNNVSKPISWPITIHGHCFIKGTPPHLFVETPLV